ncbi:unnamed protein product, partial [Mesorhabditis spiculigera]
MRMDTLLTVNDYHQKAITLLPKNARDYYESGSDDEHTLRRNIDAFSRFLIWPKCLADVSKIDMSVEFLGKKYKTPICLSPSAFHKLCHPDGELATVQDKYSYAGNAGVMICSSWGTTAMEDIAAHQGNATLWFQLYVYKHRPTCEALIRRAERAGFEALVLTADTPVLGHRLADKRNAFTLPPPLKFANILDNSDSKVRMPKVPVGDSGLMAYVSEQVDPSIDWNMLKWLVGFTRLPVIVKGVMRPGDAEMAIMCGAKAVFISNHGGRQMDSAPSTIEVLPEIVKAVRQRVPVFIDGGFRNGRDVFKALALGATAVFLGRPVLYGLTVGGAQGVENILRIMENELEVTMELSGCTTIHEIQNTKEIVVPADRFSKL